MSRAPQGGRRERSSTAKVERTTATRNAIALLAYSRPDYLRQVLASILAQQVGGVPVCELYDLYIFQDGLSTDADPGDKVGHAATATLCDEFARPDRVIRQSSNLGVALHFDFVEKRLFVERGYDFVVFCEDDLILGQDYMAVVDRMGEKFAGDPRVGLVSAHPRDCTTSLAVQRANSHRYSSMGHNWAFGLSRTFWKRRQPFVECYLALIRGMPYRQRDTPLILKWLELCGLPPAASSQDYIKSCATWGLGACRLSTFVNLATPIGRRGLHCTDELFLSMKLDQAVVYTGDVQLGALDGQQFDEIYRHSGHQVGVETVVITSDPTEWVRRLTAGELHPDHLLARSVPAGPSADFKSESATTRADIDDQDLKDAFAKVDNYHPVFGLEDRFVESTERNISRLCKDRCALLESILAPDIDRIRILDVGCSMGYISLHFASIGADVTGIDSNPNQIAFCTALAKYHNLGATFRVDEFDRLFCDSLPDCKYDVVFLFSVLHHVVLKYGLEATQAMMSRLLDAADVLFVELAQKSEDVLFAWRDALPDHDLAIFDGMADVQVQELGQFPALNGLVSRPVYKVWRTSKIFNSKIHAPLEVRHSGINDGSNPDRKYYLGARAFTKAFILDKSRSVAWQKFTSEAYAYQQLERGSHVCQFLGSEIRRSVALISMERLGGSTLMELIVTKRLVNAELAAARVLDILSAFWRAGLYWNDFRTHNIVVTGDRFCAIDFEYASPIEEEHTRNLFLWLLYDLQSAKTMTHESGIFKGDNLRIPIPPLELDDYVAELRPLARMALESRDIADLLHRWTATGGSPAKVAQRLAKTGQLAEALGWANRAIAAEPAGVEHRRLLAGILERLGRLEAARLAIAEALELAPGDRDVAADHDRILASYWNDVRQQRDTDADPVTAIDAGLRLAHSEASVAGDWSAVAQLLAKAERLNEALDWSGRAMAAAPGTVDYPRLHASVLERLGRYKAGYRTAKRALLLEPANPELAGDARRMFRKAMANFVGLSGLV